MKYGQVKTEKLYFTSSEAAEQVSVPVKTLHSWEKKYPNLKPKINRAGKRMYRPADIEIAKQISKGILHAPSSAAKATRTVALPQVKRLETNSLLKIRNSLQKVLEKIHAHKN